MDSTNIGAWYNKQNYTEFILILNPGEQPLEGYVRARPLPGVAYQTYDDQTGKWVADSNSETLAKIDACKVELAEIDLEAGAGRAVRGLALAAAERAGITSGGDYGRLKALEDKAKILRDSISNLS
jgi:hypothetical protein